MTRTRPGPGGRRDHGVVLVGRDRPGPV